MHSLPERAMRSSMCRVFPPLLVGARRSSDPHADHYSFMPRPLLLQLQSSIASHRPLVAESYNYSYGDYCIIRHSLRCLRPSGVSFTGGTPFALSLNALRLPHAAKSSKITSCACYFGDRATVSYGLSALAACAEEAIGDDAEATEHHQPASKHRIE